MKTITCVCFTLFVGMLSLPADARAQCSKDTDCKGDRICVTGVCQNPAPPTTTPPPTATPSATTTALSAPAAVHATAPPATTAPAPRGGLIAQVHRTRDWNKRPGRITLELGVGGSGCTDDCNDAFRPLAGLRLQGLYRLHRYAAAGLHLATLFLDANSEADITTVAIMAGAEGRLLLPVLRKAELWTGLTLGYVHHQSAAGDDWNNAKRSLSGFGLGWGFGASYRIRERVAVGVSFWLYAPFFRRTCYEEDGLDKQCEDLDVDNPSKDFGLYWTVGANLTVYLGK